MILFICRKVGTLMINSKQTYKKLVNYKLIWGGISLLNKELTTINKIISLNITTKITNRSISIFS